MQAEPHAITTPREGRRLRAPEWQRAVYAAPRIDMGPESSRDPVGKGIVTVKIRPLQDRILVKRIDEEEKSAGGIIIPDTAKEKPQEGKVVAVGNGKLLDDGKVHPLDVKKGDKVLFSKYGGTEVQVDGSEHLIIREDDILGILE